MGRSRPNLKFESKAIKKYDLVIGVDEVGRGALAGPVIAAAVAIGLPVYQTTRLPKLEWLKLGIDDSKRLTTAKREQLAKIIKNNAAWGVGEVGVAFINRYGIVKATEKAMRRAISNLKYQISNTNIKSQKCFVLVDAFHVKYIPGVGLKNQSAIVKGDQKSISIAAASIVAKVHRDRLMVRLYKGNKGYRGYWWHENKGYGTKEHLAAIRKFGASRLHRKQFVWKILGLTD